MSTRTKILVAYSVSVLCVALLCVCAWSRRRPTLVELEDRLAEVSDFREMPQEDVASALSLNLQCIEADRLDEGCYGGAIQWSMVLGSRRGALDVIERAKRRGIYTEAVEATCESWGLTKPRQSGVPR